MYNNNNKYLETYSDITKYTNINKIDDEVHYYLVVGTSDFSEKQRKHLITVEQLEQMVKDLRFENIERHVDEGYKKSVKMAIDKMFETIVANHTLPLEEVIDMITESSFKRMKERSDNQFIAAIKTLEHLGYAYHGGEQWKPARGEKPSYIDKCEEYVKIDFTKEDLFDLKYDLEAGVLFYEHKDKYFPVDTVQNLVTCFSAKGFKGNVYRKLALSKRDVMIREVVDIVNKAYDTNGGVLSEYDLAASIVDSGKFDLK